MPYESRTSGSGRKTIVYTPQPILIPPESGIARSVDPAYRLTQAEKAACDKSTIFNDIVLSPTKRELLCLGPPLFDLGPPRRIVAGDRVLRFSVSEPNGPKRVSIARVALDGIDVRNQEIDLQFSFDQFDVTTSIRLSDTNLDERVPMALATMQKDNEIEWIQDWCVWHYRMHGIKRIVIYDNGSMNFDEVVEQLSRIDGIDLIFVRWNYPYGPPGKYELNFPQTVAMNHCRLLFVRTATWCVNLDIDEYLHHGSGSTLWSQLRKYEIRQEPVVYLNSYVVPFVVDAVPTRCYDSPIRLSKVDRDRKYIYRPKMTRFNAVHSVSLERGFHTVLGMCRRALGKTRIVGMVKRVWRLCRSVCAATGRGTAVAGSASGTWPRDVEGLLFFYHFRALNTGWKYNRELVQMVPDEVVSDSRIVEMKSVLLNDDSLVLGESGSSVGAALRCRNDEV